MAGKMSGADSERYTGISAEVGARLSERRTEKKLTLREVASSAQVSAGHLSDIERGKTQVSLPVLLRLTRALDLTITELLPRLGGHHIRTGSLDDVQRGQSVEFGHPDLELTVTAVKLEAGMTHEINNPSLGDLLLHVLCGAVQIATSDQTYDLGAGDTFDSERVASCVVTASDDSDVLIVTPQDANSR